ncbi:MAG: alpha/beta hydrolase [Sedimentisphaerales bacterium]|nr:alpha/beta hydrolase [Sedimentisphaerales bacterium]
MKNVIVLLITLASFLLLQGCKSKETSQATSTDGITISYNVCGKGEPVLVFVHGWSCDKSFWKYQVPHFAKNHKVVTIDLGGHGQSSLGRESWTVEAFGKDVAAVINKLNLKKVILVGHSMGGPVILEAARQMPDRIIALVGADTFHDIEKGYDPQEIRNIVSALNQDFALVMKNFVTQMFPPNTDAELIEWVVNKATAANPQVAVSSIENLPKYNIKEAVKGIAIPIYSISSDFWLTDFDNNKKYVKFFEVKMMPGIGHFVMLEDPEKFNQLIDEIIDELKK